MVNVIMGCEEVRDLDPGGPDIAQDSVLVTWVQPSTASTAGLAKGSPIMHKFKVIPDAHDFCKGFRALFSQTFVQKQSRCSQKFEKSSNVISTPTSIYKGGFTWRRMP